MSSREAEKRGTLVSQASGEKQLLVLRCGTLRVFGSGGSVSVTVSQRHIVPASIIQLTHRCEVSQQPQNCLEIRAHVPYEAEHTYQAKSEDEVTEWVNGITQSLSKARERFQTHMEFLGQGSTAYKYNYSNSKRMRRHFWIDEEKVELLWAKSRTEEAQSMSLKDCVGIIFGPMTTTFQRCTTLEDPPWCCFSLLFPDRTLDLAVGPTSITAWYLGLQHLLMEKSAACVLAISEAQFVFRTVFHKLRDSAHRQGFTIWTYVVRQLRALSKDPAFREALNKISSGLVPPSKAPASTPSPQVSEDEAKAERKRAKAERKSLKVEGGAAPAAAEANGTDGKSSRRPSFAPPPREAASISSNGAAAAAVASVAAAAEQEEEDLQQMVQGLERQLQAATSQLEELRPAWPFNGQGPSFDSLSEGLQADGASWQSEKCAEIERELLQMQTTDKSMQRQLQAAEKVEKQLKKLAKQYKDSDSQIQAMEQDLGSAKASAVTSESAQFSSAASLELTEAQTSHLERRLKELELQLQQADKGGEMAVLQQQNQAQVKELERLDAEKAELALKSEAVKKELQTARLRQQENDRRLSASASASQRLGDALRKLKVEASGLQVGQQKVREECEAHLRSIADSFPPLAGAVSNIGDGVAKLMERYQEVAEERKKLHNLVLELKGNIRVFVRVRPINEKEKAQESGEATMTFAEDCKVSVFDAAASRRKWFEFDKVFSPKTAQNDVFEEVKPLATSVLDGFNVCIFAYGQTGSGKTFTMTGTDANPGLNVRVLTELFRQRDERKSETDISISLLVTEIYNETIKDLFTTDEAKQKKLDVKQNPDGTNSVPGLTELEVHCVEDVLEAMKKAQANRTTMATDMNEESSRSHSIVQVRTLNVSKKDKREYVGKINLIDLAGSENVNKSGVSGDGLREAQNINKSLSALGDVISSLVSKNPHIPYRNSKLTMMLKDSLGGDSKTLMIVQTSPAQINVTESLSSLNFASRARNVELGKAKRTMKGGEGGDKA